MITYPPRLTALKATSQEAGPTLAGKATIHSRTGSFAIGMLAGPTKSMWLDFCLVA